MATTKYTIHHIGTPLLAFPSHYWYHESEWWNNEDGWGHKSTATVFDTKDYNLPLEGEWVEIYVNEPVLQDLDN